MGDLWQEVESFLVGSTVRSIDDCGLLELPNSGVVLLLFPLIVVRKMEKGWKLGTESL
jgi:hypothetical protein